MADDMIKCPGCDVQFSAEWHRSIEAGDGPEFCPFCGEYIEDVYREGED